jgi:hypothetical protein
VNYYDQTEGVVKKQIKIVSKQRRLRRVYKKNWFLRVDTGKLYKTNRQSSGEVLSSKTKTHNRNRKKDILNNKLRKTRSITASWLLYAFITATSSKRSTKDIQYWKN